MSSFGLLVVDCDVVVCSRPVPVSLQEVPEILAGWFSVQALVPEGLVAMLVQEDIGHVVAGTVQKYGQRHPGRKMQIEHGTTRRFKGSDTRFFALAAEGAVWSMF